MMSNPPVGEDRLPAAHADGAGAARRSELVARDPAASRLKVVKPGEARLIGRLSRNGFGLGVHLVRVPADKHQELDRAGDVGAPVVLRDPFVLAESHATEPIDRDHLSDFVKGRIF
jgi:hypothetical protein